MASFQDMMIKGWIYVVYELGSTFLFMPMQQQCVLLVSFSHLTAYLHIQVLLVGMQIALCCLQSYQKGTPVAKWDSEKLKFLTASWLCQSISGTFCSCECSWTNICSCSPSVMVIVCAGCVWITKPSFGLFSQPLCNCGQLHASHHGIFAGLRIFVWLTVLYSFRELWSALCNWAALYGCVMLSPTQQVLQSCKTRCLLARLFTERSMVLMLWHMWHKGT